MKTPASVLARLGRLFNLPVTFDNGQISSKYNIPGFRYDDFDLAGRLNIYKINRLFETNRIVAMKHMKFIPEHVENPSEILVMFSQRFSVSETLHERAALHLPMTISSDMVSLGKTSYTNRRSLVDEGSGDVLASVWQKVVNMDMESRKSRDVSQDIIEAYTAAYPNGNGDEYSFPPVKREPLPVVHFCTTIDVQHSDMDFRFHVNQASYQLYSLNCASAAAAAGFYSEIRNCIQFYRVKVATTLHLSEAFFGDTLKVYTWEDTNNPLLLSFLVRKEDADIFYGTIEFYHEGPESFK